MRSLISVKTNMQTINDLITKLDDSEKQVIELKQEIMTQKRLLNVQGKSLNKMVNENDYPMKIKLLLDEIKANKEKMRQMELKNIEDQRMIFKLTNTAQTLREKNFELKKELKNLFNKFQISNSVSISQLNDESRMSEQISKMSKINNSPTEHD